MKVILVADIPGLGKKNEVKEVKDGFGRNFLLARKLAIMATYPALKELEARKIKEEKQEEKKKEAIKTIFEKIKNREFEIKENANEKGELFGSVGKEKIFEALKNQGFEGIKEEYVKLDKPIKSVGEYKIELGFEDFKINFILKVAAD